MAQNTVPVPADLRLVQRPPSGRRRAETRYQCGPATAGRLVTEPGAEPVRAWVLNLSRHGAGLLVEQPFEAKTEMLICVRSSTSDRVFQLSGRIVHCTQQVTGGYILGCELLTPLSDDDLDALL
jgi:hypothetical protein